MLPESTVKIEYCEITGKTGSLKKNSKNKAWKKQQERHYIRERI